MASEGPLPLQGCNAREAISDAADVGFLAITRSLVLDPTVLAWVSIQRCEDGPWIEN